MRMSSFLVFSFIDNGELFWMIDAYTVSGNFPYSEKFKKINYIRNSVKIVVNAYDGTMTYYVIDMSDPLIQTYYKIFPKQFKSFESMSADLKKHMRYPVDLFKIQSLIYGDYHMDDVKVFFDENNVDLNGLLEQVVMRIARPAFSLK